MRSRWRRCRRRFVPRSAVSPANAEPSHFFKMILPGTVHAQNMRIPKEFVRRFENELCTSEATIGVPDGRVWKMELKKFENEAWFCKGWEEFMKYYSISFGFFLRFKYEGNSKFSVVIFDASAAEIYYPCKINSEKQNSVSDLCAHNTRRSQRHKVADEEEIIEIEDENNALSHGKSGNKDRSGEEIDNSSKHEKEKEKERSGQVQGRSSKMKKRTLSKKQRALEAAQNFKPENAFTAIIRRANLNHRYLDVPASFRKAYMWKMRPMKLQDCEGREWEVNYGRHLSGFRIRKAWISFARANNVKEGDVCVFELIKRKKNYVFQVTIFPC